MTMHTNPRKTRGIVAVRAEAGDPAALVGQITTAFERHRDGVDSRLGAVEAGIADLAARGAAADMGGGQQSNANARVERTAWASFVRTGEESHLAEIQAAMSVGSDPDGGYTVAPSMGRTIQQVSFDVSPLARLARRVTITTGDAFEEPWDVEDIGAEWVGEKASRPETGSPKLRMLNVPVHEVYANVPITQKLIDDTGFDLGGWIEGKIADKFARKEASAYVNGDGILKPKGLLTYPVSTDGDDSRTWNTVQYHPTGASGDFIAASSSDSPADVIYDAVYSLRAPYRSNARFLMNLATAGVVRKLKDSEGRFIWADAREGQPATLAGFPVDLDEEMPTIASNSLSIAFGDFRQAYLAVDKPGLRMIRDPFTARPNVLVYAYRRTGGGLQNSEAVKFIRFSAS